MLPIILLGFWISVAGGKLLGVPTTTGGNCNRNIQKSHLNNFLLWYYFFSFHSMKVMNFDFSRFPNRNQNYI